MLEHCIIASSLLERYIFRPANAPSTLYLGKYLKHEPQGQLKMSDNEKQHRIKLQLNMFSKAFFNMF